MIHFLYICLTLLTLTSCAQNDTNQKQMIMLKIGETIIDVVEDIKIKKILKSAISEMDDELKKLLKIF